MHIVKASNLTNAVLNALKGARVRMRAPRPRAPRAGESSAASGGCVSLCAWISVFSSSQCSYVRFRKLPKKLKKIFKIFATGLRALQRGLLAQEQFRSGGYPDRSLAKQSKHVHQPSAITPQAGRQSVRGALAGSGLGATTYYSDTLPSACNAVKHLED